MMAFFLLLWLLNSVTQEQLEGIAEHFAPISVSSSTSGSGEILGGKVMGEEGAMDVSASRATVTLDLPPPSAGSGGEASDANEEASRQKEEKQFEDATEELRQAIDSVPSLKRLAKSILIDNTPEGLRIQIVDQKGLAMFPSGGAEMYLHTKKVLELVTKVILGMPQKISISGHTDSVKFHTDSGYSNWELSSDRANASRRVIERFGIPYERVAKVVGKAATEPLLPDDPESARNRRLSIVLLRGTGRDKETAPAPGQTPALPELPKDMPQGQVTAPPAPKTPAPKMPAASRKGQPEIPPPPEMPAAPQGQIDIPPPPEMPSGPIPK
ncbi:MAG: OmpA family protein, partial [Rhodospirillales bacterium]